MPCTPFSIFYNILWGFLRRWFGGLFDEVPLLKSRGIQTVVMILSMLPLFMCYGFATALVTSLWLQFMFWSKGHGPVFDRGNGGKSSSDTLRRYKEMWGYNLACKLFPEKMWYGYWFDGFLMSIRYTLPMALPALYFLEPGYILIGLSISPIYGLCWTLKNKGYINVSATQVAEVFSGFVFGYIWYLPDPEAKYNFLSLTFKFLGID